MHAYYPFLRPFVLVFLLIQYELCCCAWQNYKKAVVASHILFTFVLVSDDASVGGTYTGKEPMGLLWSMRPVPGSRTGLR